MADPLKPIDRASLTQTDQQKYEAGGNFGLEASSKAGKGTYVPKNDLASRYKSGTSFGNGSKDAGNPGYTATNMVDSSNKNQKEFRTFAQRGVTSFQPAALDYAAKQYKISSTKYKG
jgi:hypothetical protein